MASPQGADSTRLSLRTKILGGTGIFGIVLVGILTFAFWMQMRDGLLDELTKRARAVGIGMAFSVAASAAANDSAMLQAGTDMALKSVPDVAYIVVRDPSGRVLARSADDRFATAASVEPADGDGVVDRLLTVGTLPIVETTAPILSGPPGGALKRVGTVQLALDREALAESLASSTWRTAGLGLLVLVLGLLAAAGMASLFIVPLERLARAAVGIAAGDLRQQIDVNGTDEIGELARSFATMATRWCTCCTTCAARPRTWSTRRRACWPRPRSSPRWRTSRRPPSTRPAPRWRRSPRPPSRPRPTRTRSSRRRRSRSRSARRARRSSRRAWRAWRSWVSR
ncbi:HAMP domain-containing protein [Corallococcus sp. 4LFB]|uniref:HAMP domain-containing protein n=1 Tax=Corallococcus sp. 4LFB TaxID=3383249 RepID=UPI00397519F4